MFAVIKTGGKQYRVSKGDKIFVEKLAGEAGSGVFFDEVLLVGNEDGSDVKVGAPLVSGAKVEGKIIEQTRDDKKIVFKFHSKTRRRKKKGHQQPLTKVEVTNISE